MPLDYQMKSFLGQTVQEAKNLTKELANQIQNLNFQEEVGDTLIRTASEIIARIQTVCQVALGEKGKLSLQKLLFDAVIKSERFDFAQVQEDIYQNLKYLPLSHGLSSNEPLTIQSIIKGCFSNPNRRKYPDFLRDKGWSSCDLYTEHEDPVYFINLLKPELIQEFNKAQIDLTDTSTFSISTYIDKEPYLEAIRAQTWHGPYKIKSGDQFFFVSINQSGDNMYFVLIQFKLNIPPTQDLYLRQYRNKSQIALRFEFQY